MTLLFSETTHSPFPPVAAADINNSSRQNALPGGPNVEEKRMKKETRSARRVANVALWTEKAQQ